MKSSHLERKAVSEIAAIFTTWPKVAAAKKIVLVIIIKFVVIRAIVVVRKLREEQSVKMVKNNM